MRRQYVMGFLAALLFAASFGGLVLAQEQVTISFWGNVGPEWVATYREFERQHPNIKVEEAMLSPEWASSAERFLAAMAAGVAPDVSYQNSHQFAQWAADGAFLALNDYVDGAGLTEDDWLLATHYQGAFFEDNLYAMPMITDTRLLFWNKDLFAEVGLDPEVPPTTWTEIEEMTEQLLQRDDRDNITQFGFLPYFGNTWTWLYAWLNGAEFLDETGRIVTVNEPRVVYALEWMVDFYDRYADGAEVAAGFIEGFQQAAQDPFVLGKVGMVGTGNWNFSTFATFPDLNYGVAPMPLPDTDSAVNATWSCGSFLSVSANTDHPDEAWTFVNWLSGPEGALAYAEADLANRQREWRRQRLEGDPVYVPLLYNRRDTMEALEEAHLSLLPEKVQEEYLLALESLSWTRSCTEMSLVGLTYWNELHDATQAALYHQMSAQEALDLAQERVQRALDEAWAGVDGN